jgi:hypothetical protein
MGVAGMMGDLSFNKMLSPPRGGLQMTSWVVGAVGTNPNNSPRGRQQVLGGDEACEASPMVAQASAGY